VIVIDQTRRGFEARFRGRPIIRHTRRRPCLKVGRGRGRYRMRHGSFTIKEPRPTAEPLRAFEIVSSNGRRAEISLGSQPVGLVLEVVDGRLEIRLEGVPDDVNRVWLELVGSPSEHIYGCGEQYSRLDLKGSRVPLWVEEQGVGRGRDLVTALANVTAGAGGSWYTTYFPQPTFISSEGYFCQVETSDYAVFDFTAGDRHRLYIWGVPDRLVVDIAANAPALLESLSGYLGRQPDLPEWVFDGMWLGLQGGEQVVRRKLDRALEHGVKVKAVWAQDWVGQRITAFGKQLMWNWEHDDERYPDLPRYIQELGERGINFLGYINCFLATEGNLYRVARERGYLVRDHSGDVYHVTVTTFPAAILDLSNPEACKWIKGVIKENLLGAGLAGWMADFGEYLPTDAVLWSGESPESFHNRYPVIWARLNYEAVQEAGQLDRAVFFTRAGYSGTSRYSTMVWAGDQLVNWSLDDGLATVIPAGLSLGMSGIGYFHADLGGYTTFGWIKRSKELFLRWAEAAAFSPLMRTHEGNRPDDNWQFDSDEETLRHLARMTEVHTGLKAYLVHSAGEYSRLGLPLMRHPFLHYEGDEELHRQRYEYLLGRDLLVAPVYLPHWKSWRVYLPRDRWVHLWSGERLDGGWHKVPAPIGEPPVFYREDSAFAPLFKEVGGS
jgi:alpha-glucosidase